MDLPPPPPSPRPWRSDAILLALAVVLVTAIGTALAWTFLAHRGVEVVSRPPSTIPSRAPGSPASAAPGTPSAGESCGPVQQVLPFDPEADDRAHAEVALSRYPSVPPASGPHAPATLPAGSYPEPPPMGQVIHSLEHGAVVIWFEPSVASSEGLRRIGELMGPSGPNRGLHVIIAPYDYPAEGKAGGLPPGVAMAMVAWHRLQYCTRLGADAPLSAVDFVRNYRCHPGCDMNGYMGEAPEAGAPI